MHTNTLLTFKKTKNKKRKKRNKKNKNKILEIPKIPVDAENSCREYLDKISRLNEQNPNKINCNKIDNIGSLFVVKPAQLFCVPVKIETENCLALIDSGATVSFVSREIIYKLGIEINNDDTKQVTAYGNVSRTTLGSVVLKFDILGIVKSFKFQVLNENMNHSVILGVDFLKQYKAVVNVRQNNIKLELGKDAHVTAIIKDNKVVQTYHVKIPIYSTETENITKSSNKLIKFNLPEMLLGDNEHYLIEGRDNDKFYTHPGLVTINEQKLLIQNNNEHKSLKIYKGEQLGTISTVMVINDETEPTDDSWTYSKLRNDITIEHPNMTNDEKTKVYDMLLQASAALSINDNDIGLAEAVPHRMEMLTEVPIWQKPRQFPTPITEEIEKQCQELLNSDIIVIMCLPFKCRVHSRVPCVY